jgi:hypothetical protein
MPLTAPLSPNQSDIQKAVGYFLADVTGLPQAALIAAQPNRVPEPKLTDFIVVTVLRFQRLRTNVDRVIDSKFTGTIADTTLTITEILIGAGPADGSVLFGVGVTPGTRVVTQLTGTLGGVGDYQVDSELALPASQTFAAGFKVIEIASEVTVQLDFHSAKYASSSAAQAFSAAFRDGYGVSFFSALDAPLNRITPLYADDPQMRAFINAETNYEWRWVLDARFQVNQTIAVPQEFYDALTVELIDVDAVYPPDGSLDFSNPNNSQFIPGGL